nr:MAG TPA_asm: hypothetical protein [Caudoviricetes sp.]
MLSITFIYNLKLFSRKKRLARLILVDAFSFCWA